MQTLSEKITFVLAGLGYLLFHLGWGPDFATAAKGTLAALLNTLPYELGLTYLIAVFIRRATGGHWPPWDRTLRIFFTIGILFGLIYGLYVRGALEEARQKGNKVSVERCAPDERRRPPSYWA